MRDYFRKNDPIRFRYPLDGDCLNTYDGTVMNGWLTVPVGVEAPDGAEVYIDEKKRNTGTACTQRKSPSGHTVPRLPLRTVQTVPVQRSLYTG